jgi:hypothetical protein
VAAVRRAVAAATAASSGRGSPNSQKSASLNR